MQCLHSLCTYMDIFTTDYLRHTAEMVRIILNAHAQVMEAENSNCSYYNDPSDVNENCECGPSFVIENCEHSPSFINENCKCGLHYIWEPPFMNVPPQLLLSTLA